ncbi:MAG: GNAT family N-acetyltransferase [Deltaproteobacteria bacterium]|nr:GNAT family N-acetyltransferase [Deltaproteobacteria bacterium]
MGSPAPPPLAGWCHAGVDKAGRRFSLYLCGAGEGNAALRDLYDAFEPKGCTLCLPPLNDDRRTQWLEGLLEQGVNVLALADGIVVGHATVMGTENEGVGEYLVFVRPEYQNCGFGTALSEAVVEIARALGYRWLWVLVEGRNRRAIHVGRKVGFQMEGPVAAEREMLLDLASGPV